VSNGFIISSYLHKKHVKVACDLHRTVFHCSQLHYNSHVSSYQCSLHGESSFTAVKGKSIQLQAWTGPERPRSLRFPHFKATDTCRWLGFKSYSPADFTPRKNTCCSLVLESESTQGP